MNIGYALSIFFALFASSHRSCLVHSLDIFDHGSTVFDSHPPNPPERITVGAYYYPWHYRHFQHSSQGYLRNQLSPRQELRLGEYDDRETSVIQQHLEWSKQGNIGVWITSWWGPNSGEDQTLKGTIMNSSKVELGDHKIALLYETTGRIKKDANGVYDYEKNVPSDFQYICQTSGYFDHPNYYRINGKPVVAMYLTRVLDSNHILDDVIPIIREICPDIYIIGDEVWGNPSGNTANLLDAITNYDVYGNMGRPRGYAGQQRVDDYFALAAAWKEADAVHQSAFVPSVSAGYNDRGVRLSANHPAMSRKLTANSAEGSLFAAQLVQAVELLDEDADHLLLVNSFNEWHEDTQIEPCDGLPATEPFELTEGLEYGGYGTLYLDILATYTQYNDTGFSRENYTNGLRANLLPKQTSMSKDDDAIAEDLEISWLANIRTWITPWVSPAPHRTDVGAQTLFQHSYLEFSEHKVALQYDLRARALKQGDEDVSTKLLASDIEYLCDNYFHKPSYFTTESGEPVLFLALSRIYSDSQLSTIVAIIREVSEGSGCGKELFLVGDQVWGDFSTPTPYAPFTYLDAVMNHDVFGNMGEPDGYAGTAAVADYYEKQRKWRIAAWQGGCSYIPTVLPGYNDRAKRFDQNHPVLSRVLKDGGEEGSFFVEAVDRAKHLLDSRLKDLILINSFNHFTEDTQIYPVFGDATSLPLNYTKGLTYEGYGTTYLDILTEEFGSFDLPSSSPTQVPTVPPTPSPSGLPSASPSRHPSSTYELVPKVAEVPQSTTIFADGFEGGFAKFSDGGRNAQIVTNVKYQGSKSLRLRNGNRSSRSMTKQFYNVSEYASVQWSFTFLTKRISKGERFFVEYRARGGSWKRAKVYKRGINFRNGVWKTVSHTIDVSNIEEIQLRFRTKFSADNHVLFLDKVVLEGSTAVGA
eukprot:Nitzschia sp. Nitz4//scaffold185_size43419//16920//19772//NITZ4_007301-RA/size43419-snap-gene-0.64-mRNA-1//-1//CDS//3329539709//6585//frame0